MDSIALWFASTLGQYVSKEVVIFIISMIPILACLWRGLWECRF